jgi:hypothetical protein
MHPDFERDGYLHLVQRLRQRAAVRAEHAAGLGGVEEHEAASDRSGKRGLSLI